MSLHLKTQPKLDISQKIIMLHKSYEKFKDMLSYQCI